MYEVRLGNTSDPSSPWSKLPRLVSSGPAIQMSGPRRKSTTVGAAHVLCWVNLGAWFSKPALTDTYSVTLYGEVC